MRLGFMPKDISSDGTPQAHLRTHFSKTAIFFYSIIANEELYSSHILFKYAREIRIIAVPLLCGNTQAINGSVFRRFSLLYSCRLKCMLNRLTHFVNIVLRRYSDDDDDGGGGSGPLR